MTTIAAPMPPSPANPLRRLLFVETITAPGQPNARGRLDETQARSLLRRAATRGYAVEATRSGGALITWTVKRLGPADGQVTTSPRSVALDPVTPARITPAVRRDLEAVDDSPGAALFLAPDARTPGHGRIRSGLYSIPPATSERLITGGLLTLGEITPARDWARDSFGAILGTYTSVRLSLVARLAMHAADHHTSTGEPRGWVSMPHSAGRQDRGGRGYDRSSWANCACHWSTFAEDRPDAARRAREHRQSRTAALITSL